MSNNTHTFRELLPNKSKHIFRVHIKHYWHFEEITPKQYHTLFQKLSNTDIFKELLPNNTTHFSKHQAIRTFSESYWEIIPHNFTTNQVRPIQKVPKKFKIFPTPSYKKQKKDLARHKKIYMGRGEYIPWKVRIQIKTTRNLLGDQK